MPNEQGKVTPISLCKLMDVTAYPRDRAKSGYNKHKKKQLNKHNKNSQKSHINMSNITNITYKDLI